MSSTNEDKLLSQMPSPILNSDGNLCPHMLWWLLGAAMTSMQPHVLHYRAVQVFSLDSHDPRITANPSQDKAETEQSKP